jgi:hypothetical protein
VVITVPKMPAHCFVRLHASGDVFRWGKYIFGFRVIYCIYWALIRAPGRVQWDGLQRMGLDDNVPMRKVLPFRDVHIALGSGSLLGRVFHTKNLSMGK